MVGVLRPFDAFVVLASSIINLFRHVGSDQIPGPDPAPNTSSWPKTMPRNPISVEQSCPVFLLSHTECVKFSGVRP